MRGFEQITVGGCEWCVYGKSDKSVNLCSVRSVYKSRVFEASDSYNGTADFKGSIIEKYLNSKFVHKLCGNGLSYEMIIGTITIFDADTVRQIADASFMLPAVAEGRWWLKGKTVGGQDKAVSNYMLQADNNLDIHKECGIAVAGVRAVMTLNRAALTKEQDELVDSAACLFDKTTLRETGSLYVRNTVSKVFRKERTTGKSRAHDKVYRLRFNIVITPLPSVSENDALLREIKDKAQNKGKLCNVSGVVIESVSISPEHVHIVINTGRNPNLDAIIDSIKSYLVPRSMIENRNVFARMFGQKPSVWYSGYLLDTSDIPMSTIQEYIDTVINGGGN